MNNMRINGLRKELDIFLRAADTVRPPALRRSLQEEWLYSSDLPMICTEAGLEETERRLKEAGWETGREAGVSSLDGADSAAGNGGAGICTGRGIGAGVIGIWLFGGIGDSMKSTGSWRKTGGTLAGSGTGGRAAGASSASGFVRDAEV